ncbi:MAG: M20 family metallopeptidase [Candidatus Neomarinimicrobiota bacterium]
MSILIRREVKAIQPELVEWRQHLHKHPELGFEEVETARFVADVLEDFDIRVSTGVGKTGVVGLLKGKREGPCIGLRADMDGLPIQETGEVPFASVNEGVMHACGHDGHMAMLLGAAKVLSGMKEKLKGSVKFIFQPAEEGEGGAVGMIEDGVLESPHVDQIYGLHLWNYQYFGTVGIKEGPILAATVPFTITVKGRGGHGAAPQGTVDAIVVAAHLVTSLQTIVSRNTNPLESAVITVGKIEGGHTFNVIADKVVLQGTARAYTETVRELIISRMNEIISGVEATFGADISLEYGDGYPPTINSSAETKVASSAAGKIVGEGAQFPYMSMGGEDFSYYLQKVPGCFFFVGSAPEDSEPMSVPHHCSHFNFDERALAVGSSIFVQLVEDLLNVGG